MLQIANGKLFALPIERENRLRGLLYTNAVFADEATLVTAAGSISPSSSHSIRPRVLIYEFNERMEQAADGRSSLIVSSTVDPYIQDFSVVVSFALSCICTPDVDLARRLTAGERGLATMVTPQELVRNFFDKDHRFQPDDAKLLTEFTEKFIGLPRSTFLSVMRAIRTYVNGMHRIADDLELAYTLLVASVESLAQDFEAQRADWSSFDERKRRAVDRALTDASVETSERVKNALLDLEHTGIKRRFKEFSIEHTSPNFFREPIAGAELRLGRSDLAGALGLAYDLRSKHVHELRRLPDELAMGRGYSETAIINRATHLTLQGLARLMRSVILEFVTRQPSVVKEPYPYTRERSGLVQMRLAPMYWVGSAEGDIRSAGRDKLEGFLQQLESCVLKHSGAIVTDMRQVLEKVAGSLSSLPRCQRLPYLALHILFDANVPKSKLTQTTSIIENMIEQELQGPSPESLIVHALIGQRPEWSLSTHRETLDSYFKKRDKRSGIRFPRTFDAAISLDLAERYRLAEDLKHCKTLLGLAVENHPGHLGLLDFERSFQKENPVKWRDILL